jgi:SAM-dependent methyltransferase
VLLCPRCTRLNPPAQERCECGFAFRVEPVDLPAWFDDVRSILEPAYLAAPTPWQQSGKSGSYEDWVRLRIPIAECVQQPGAFLDIGCANGFLLECLLDWTRRKAVPIEPYGLDMSEKLLTLAKLRLPDYGSHLFAANAWDWQPPRRFDYVRTELVYVPANLRFAYLTRLLHKFLTTGGSLLVAHYRSRAEDLTRDWVDEELRALEFKVAGTTSGFDSAGQERTRVAIIRAE